MKNKKTDKENKKNETIANAEDEYCLRGRKFEGYVIKKFEKRITIRFEKIKYMKKYERYIKAQSKMHARLPEKLKDSVNIGDYIQIMECRPLSKILHFVVVKKIRDKEEKIKVEDVK